MHNCIFFKKRNHFVSEEHLHLYFPCGHKICEFSFLRLLVQKEAFNWEFAFPSSHRHGYDFTHIFITKVCQGNKNLLILISTGLLVYQRPIRMADNSLGPSLKSLLTLSPKPLKWVSAGINYDLSTGMACIRINYPYFSFFFYIFTRQINKDVAANSRTQVTKGPQTNCSQFSPKLMRFQQH